MLWQDLVPVLIATMLKICINFYNYISEIKNLIAKH